MIIYIYNFRFFHHFHHNRYIRSEKPLEQAIFERDKKCDKSDMCDEFYVTQYRCQRKKREQSLSALLPFDFVNSKFIPKQQTVLFDNIDHLYFEFDQIYQSKHHHDQPLLIILQNVM